MRRLRFVIIGWTLTMCMLLSGCWDKGELNEYGFVQALGIDQSDEGKIELTTHFYRPSIGSMSGSPGQESGGFNITTSADTMFEAIRDITIKLGRKSKWDHIRVVIISEELLKKEHIGNMLDLLSRDHEPRATMYLMVTPGKAKSFLTHKPYIENTIGQQFRQMVDVTVKYAGKTIRMTMLDLALQLKSETGIAMVPRLRNTTKNGLYIAGVNLLKDGRLKGTLSPLQTEYLLMLRNEYARGTIEYPCSTESSNLSHETMEVINEKTKISMVFNENEPRAKIKVKIKGDIGELHCNRLKTKEDETRISDIIREKIKNDLHDTLTNLQHQKLDAIRIGNQIYRTHPALWKKWKPHWEDRFAEMTFDIDVQLTDLNSGLNAPTPFGN